MTEFIINTKGEIIRRDTVERVVMPTDAAIDRLCVNASRSIANLAQLDGANLSLRIDGTVRWFTVNLPTLTLRTPFKLIEKTVLVPDFRGDKELTRTMVWTPPAGCRLIFLISSEVKAHANHVMGKSWLFAFDEKGVNWRLPLGNLYEDCAMCMGENKVICGTALAMVQQGVALLIKSEWNSDLQHDEDYQEMFRFEMDGKVTKQLEVKAKTWTSLCTKVAVDAMTKVVL